MTVVTIPFSEKTDKLEIPLVVNEQINDVDPKDVESATEPEPQYLILRAQARRVSSATTTCLFLTAVLMMSIGIIGGVYLYHQFARVNRFRGWCSIPYDASKTTMYTDNRNYVNKHSGSVLADSDLFKSLSTDSDAEMIVGESNVGYHKFFKEEFEIDLQNEKYEKIDVPDFRGGRQGRFVHDFSNELTGIVDTEGHRCFVMPLDHHQVLPPRSMFDLLSKMWNGYYDVDTEIVRKTMRVVIPPVTNLKSIGPFIAKECRGLPIYKLEKAEGAIVKRSVDDEGGATFGVFAGKKILELHIVDLPENVPEPVALAEK